MVGEIARNHARPELLWHHRRQEATHLFSLGQFDEAARRFTALRAEAERIGLVSLCVKDEDLENRALEVAVQLANGAPNAIRWTKYALNNWLRLAGPTFDASTALEMLGFTSGEAKEGVSSLKEKRDPEFKKGSRI